MVAEVAVDRTGELGLGLRGNGGGALSGSELSHLRKDLVISSISWTRRSKSFESTTTLTLVYGQICQRNVHA